MPKFIPAEVHYFATDQLAIHPALEHFPGLSDDQSAALDLSVKENGIQQPLITDEDLNVIDGRARLASARANDLIEVPVVIQPGIKDVLGYAIESAVNRRQLIHSAKAFLVFEQHPELAAARGAKAGRPKKSVQVVPISDQEPSFTRLAEKYGLDRRLFITLCDAHRSLSSKDWELLRHKVFVEEVPLGRAFAGIQGGVATTGATRMEAQYFPGWESDAAWGRSLFAASLTTVRNALARYDQSDRWVKKRVQQEIADFWEKLPEEVRAACMEALT